MNLLKRIDWVMVAVAGAIMASAFASISVLSFVLAHVWAFLKV